MKKLLISFFALFAIAIAAHAADYKVDDQAIDALIERSAESGSFGLMADAPAMIPAPAAKASGMEVQPAVALVLNFVVGYFGIHRHYMGTAKGMWALYTFTAGGIFGIVDLVDFIMLVIGTVNNDVSKYIDNKKFFMWA